MKKGLGCMGRIVLDLSAEKWQCEHIRPGQGVKEEFHKIPCEHQGAAFNWNYVKVPGDVYTDLQRVGEIEDPFFGQNMHKMKWVQEQEYWYMCKFNVPAEMKGKVINVVFEGVDFSCHVWLNGYELGGHKGMFSQFAFEISPYVKFEDWFSGSNILIIRLDPPPRNYERVAGMKFNFNGDYHTGLVPFGIWRPVKIVATETIKIDNARIESEVNGNNATVSVDIQVDNLVAASDNITIELTIEGKNCDTKTIIKSIDTLIRSGENNIVLNVGMEDANLWWPWDMGEQNLHFATIKLIKENEIIDELVETFGIRQIELAMNPGYTKEEAENPWTFVINGKATYMRAACWGGQPSLLYGRNNDAKYVKLLNLVKESNINHLRIFGWHPPEIPVFYNLCDELGITVWTNFTFSTSVIRKELPFANDMIKECMAVVKERRNHPSAIFWMSGEEMTYTEAHAESGNKKLMTMVGEEIKKYTNTPYGLSTPLSNETGVKMGFKPKESMHAVIHYYGAGAIFMEDYYPKLDCCVVPELTAASAPNIASLKKFIPEDELWPMGMSWAYHWADIDYLKMLNVEVFDDVKMGSLEEFVEATQLAHGIILQFALEVYRRRKPKNSLVAICHFITHWPDIKWGLVDYYGEKKRCFDYVKRSFSPLLISLAYDKRRWEEGEKFRASIWIVNDYYRSYDNLTIRYTVADENGKLIAEEALEFASVESNSSKEYLIFACPTPTGKSFGISIELLKDKGEVIAENTYTLLIGSQEKAKEICMKMRTEALERASKYPGFYKYFPEKWESTII